MTTQTATAPKKSTKKRGKTTRPSRAPQYVSNHACWQTWTAGGTPTAAPGLSSRFLDDESRAVFTELCNELRDRLATRIDPVRAVDGFLAQGETLEERRNRSATVRILEKLSGMRVKADPLPTWLSAVNERRRPFTVVEAVLVRLCAYESPRRANLVGFSEAGLGSGELHLILPDDVTLDSNLRATHVVARGTQRSNRAGYPVAAPRRLTIPGWAQDSIGSHAATARQGQPMLYDGKATDPQDRQSSVLTTIGNVLEDAGLKQDPTVSPLSIRNTAALVRYRAEGIEAAASFLGIDDLNSVLREIGVRPHLTR